MMNTAGDAAPTDVRTLGQGPGPRALVLVPAVVAGARPTTAAMNAITPWLPLLVDARIRARMHVAA